MNIHSTLYLGQRQEQNTYTAFDSTIEKFIKVNQKRYQHITSEATQYIREKASEYGKPEIIVVIALEEVRRKIRLTSSYIFSQNTAFWSDF